MGFRTPLDKCFQIGRIEKKYLPLVYHSVDKFI